MLLDSYPRSLFFFFNPYLTEFYDVSNVNLMVLGHRFRSLEDASAVDCSLIHYASVLVPLSVCFFMCFIKFMPRYLNLPLALVNGTDVRSSFSSWHCVKLILT